MWNVVLHLLTLTVIVIFFNSVQIVQAVDRSNFKKCEQSGFCKLVYFLFAKSLVTFETDIETKWHTCG